MTTEEIGNMIKFCLDIILKEAREETRLVKQIFYVMLSMYTNNPINLAINAPSGEGKNYVIKKVGELFHKGDVIFLAGLSEKALYHRHGILVVKNPETGEYESIEERLEEIDEKIQDKDSEAYAAQSNDLKRALRNQIKDLQKEKKDLAKDAMKLIDLSHKTLVLLDTPSRGLFGAIMSLLSHDQWEVEYEYADTSNTGIDTKTNVLRGWPSVIFAQAVDYSNYSRWAEVQRRFIITNPNMDPTKYNAAIDLMADKFGSPDFAYQAKVVSNEEKDSARDIVEEIKGGLLELTSRSLKPGENNVIVPFITPLNKSLARQKASDMTMGYRLFSFLSLLPQINFYSRPYMQVTDPNRNILFIQRIPFALFEDLNESTYLMEYADGVRPYILMWYHQVFLPTYNAKDKLDSRVNSKGVELIEKRLAVTTEQLAKATETKQNKIMSKTQVRENYIEPLINQGYIDKIDSELDKRSDIYYPVILKIDKLNGMGNPCNLSQETKIEVLDSAIFPDKTYLKTSILTVCNYTIQKGLEYKIISPDKKEITIDELVDRYYNNPEDYFSLNNTKHTKQQQSSKTDFENVYSQTSENKGESQETSENNIESISSERKLSEKLHGTADPSNLSNFQQSTRTICDQCGQLLDPNPFYAKHHHCEGTD